MACFLFLVVLFVFNCQAFLLEDLLSQQGGGGHGGGGRCVCVGVCVWGWGVSGMPDSGAVQNGGGERLSFQTLRQEARQSPKRTHVELR